MNDPCESTTQGQGGRPEELRLLGKQLPRGILEEKVEVCGDEANRPRIRMEPQQVPMKGGRLRGIAMGVFPEGSRGTLMDLHALVLEPSEKDVVGLVLERCVAGALGDGHCKGPESGE